MKLLEREIRLRSRLEQRAGGSGWWRSGGGGEGPPGCIGQGRWVVAPPKEAVEGTGVRKGRIGSQEGPKCDS